MPLCPETSGLRQDIGNEEHATGKQADLTSGARCQLAKSSAGMCILLVIWRAQATRWIARFRQEIVRPCRCSGRAAAG